jgi:DNA-binding LytR/AlgR family response regulator
MIRAIAIDDEPPALKVIEKFCEKIDFITLEKTFTQPTEALKYLRKFPIDLLFLDINMPSLSGIEFYKAVQQNAGVIFTTAFSEFAVEGFNLNAVDYLLKPYTYERFLQAVTKANEFHEFNIQAEKATEQYLFVRADYSLLKIAVNEILYIEGLDDYLKIHVKDNKPVVARMTMKGILEKLPSKDFVRVHRSFIVAFHRISAVRNKSVFLDNTEIPVGSSYEKDFLALFGNP